MERFKEFGRVSKRFLNKSKPKEESAYANFVTDFKEEKFSIIWRIENIHRCTLKCEEFLETPSFSAGPSSEVKWTLRFYPKGRKTPEIARHRNDYENVRKDYENVGLFIKRISTDPVESSFKCRFICERRLLNIASKANSTFFYPEEGVLDISDSTKSTEYGTIFSGELKMLQTLIVRCNIYVINAYNTGTSGNILGK